ncbi:MAG: leucine-rich repeat protein [Clostridiales bacterium]|jgi:hypothetical protein|nr:leucine-rich repeat protein [Clostridiales bacterium]
MSDQQIQGKRAAYNAAQNACASTLIACGFIYTKPEPSSCPPPKITPKKDSVPKAGAKKTAETHTEIVAAAGNPVKEKSVKEKKEKPVREKNGGKNGKGFITFFGLILLAAVALTSGVFAERYFGKEEEKEEVYAVVFVVDGETHYETTVKKGGEVTFPEVEPTKDGYEFAGWVYEGGTLFEGGSANGNFILTAKWIEIDTETPELLRAAFKTLLGSKYKEIVNDNGYDEENFALLNDALANGLAAIDEAGDNAAGINEVYNNALAEMAGIQGRFTEGLEYMPTDDGWEVAYGDAVDSEVIIPAIYKGQKTVRIADYGFECQEHIMSVKIPNGVTSIGYGAFYECYGLTEINLPDSLTSIGDSAFYSCKSLTEIDFSNTNLTTIGEDAFYSCKSLTEIDFSKTNLTTIGDWAFDRCESLNRIDFPGGLTYVDQSMFERCYSLASINVSADNEAYMSDEDGVLYNKTQTDLIYYPQGKTASRFTIPSSVTSIADYAFEDCISLTEINFHLGLTTIGYAAFYNCGLFEIDLPDNLAAIGASAFSHCPNLTKIDLPDNLTTIGGYAFSHCPNLREISFPDNLTTIGDGAFAFCDKLTQIIIPEKVTIIGYRAFEGCGDLTIYAKAGSLPDDGWNSSWNISNHPVYWYSGAEKSGNYWHYEDADGVKVPTPWNE